MRVYIGKHITFKAIKDSFKKKIYISIEIFNSLIFPFTGSTCSMKQPIAIYSFLNYLLLHSLLPFCYSFFLEYLFNIRKLVNNIESERNTINKEEENFRPCN